LASEAYTSRMNSPKPHPAALSLHGKRPSSGAQPAVESPLAKESFNLHDVAHNEHALESEVEDEVIHIEHPAHRHDKMHDLANEDLGPERGNKTERGGWVVDDDDGIPILASDEVAKQHPESVYWQPAVSPTQERKGHDFYDAYASDSSAHGISRRRSGEKLRSGSGGELSRFKSREALQPSGAGTPLEEIEEYEPLFPEDDDKPVTAADKLKRPDLARHHFPSQDIWEDVPESLNFQAEVSGPQEPEDLTSSVTFETPEMEQARKEGVKPEDRADFLSEEAKRMAKSAYKPGVSDDMTRPGIQRRFPSRDIWEDSPDSLQLETTVDTPQMEDEDVSSTADVKSPQIPQRPTRTSKLSEVSTHESEEVSKPQVPARPDHAPVVPERPKPQVPARPARGETTQPQEGASLERVVSPPAVKPKPAVPTRPAGNKFAALKAGFLENLNAKLGSGPAPPPKHEEPAEAPVEEKAPLADARKGRARGPARRKPAAESAVAAPPSAVSSLSVGSTFTVFQIDDDGKLSVETQRISSTVHKDTKETHKVAAANTEGIALSNTSSADNEKVTLSGLPAQAIGHIGDTPDPKISQKTMDRADAIQPEFAAALADSKRHGEEPASGETDIIPAMNKLTSEIPLPGQSAISGTRGPEGLVGNAAQEPESKNLVEEKHEGTSDGGIMSKIGQSVNNAVSYVSESVAETVQQQHVKPAQMTSSSVQTGQQDITINSPTGEQEKMTVHLGGRAPEEGNVIVKGNGEEVLSGGGSKV
jgi:hypothetical protein